MHTDPRRPTPGPDRLTRTPDPTAVALRAEAVTWTAEALAHHNAGRVNRTTYCRAYADALDHAAAVIQHRADRERYPVSTELREALAAAVAHEASKAPGAPSPRTGRVAP